jgi:hypothetical protein
MAASAAPPVDRPGPNPERGRGLFAVTIPILNLSESDYRITRQRDGQIRLDIAGWRGDGEAECLGRACPQFDVDQADVEVDRAQLTLRRERGERGEEVYRATGRVEGHVRLTGDSGAEIVSDWRGSVEGIVLFPGEGVPEFESLMIDGMLLDLPGLRIAIDHVGAG